MRFIVTLILGTFLAVSASASERPVVVELYTSQGCSSCPPADALLGELAKDPDVIALAFHVDYWDYIGWPDPFAERAYTQRQRGYARAQGERTVYTPQMIMDGRSHVVGNNTTAVRNAINEYKEMASVMALNAENSNGRVTVFAPEKRLSAKADVLLIEYMPSATTEVLRGENAGRKLTYHNIVRSVQKLGTWSSSGAKILKGRQKFDLPAVILVQEVGHGPILAATQFK